MKKMHTFDEVFDSQGIFRLILTAMSNPAKTVNIKEFSNKMFGNTPDFLAVAIALLDNEVSFYTCGNEELAYEIVLLTLSKIEKIENADFIFVLDLSMLPKVIECSKCGTLRDPHKSATVVVKIDDRKDVLLTLSGPGIDKTTALYTSLAVKEALELRDNQFYEYPQGVDFIFIADNGELFAIPRLTRTEEM